jgi:heat shock protein HtpX
MNQVKTVALLGLLSGLLIAISYSVLGGATGAIAGMALAAITNLGAWYFRTALPWRPIVPSPSPVTKPPNFTKWWPGWRNGRAFLSRRYM